MAGFAAQRDLIVGVLEGILLGISIALLPLVPGALLYPDEIERLLREWWHRNDPPTPAQISARKAEFAALTRRSFINRVGG